MTIFFSPLAAALLLLMAFMIGAGLGFVAGWMYGGTK